MCPCLRPQRCACWTRSIVQSLQEFPRTQSQTGVIFISELFRFYDYLVSLFILMEATKEAALLRETRVSEALLKVRNYNENFLSIIIGSNKISKVKNFLVKWKFARLYDCFSRSANLLKHNFEIFERISEINDKKIWNSFPYFSVRTYQFEKQSSNLIVNKFTNYLIDTT